MTFSPAVKRQLWAIIGFAVAVLILMALLRSDYYELVLTQVLLWAVMSLAWNILCGYSGYFSFGHAAFWGLGAYTVALGLIHFDLSPWLTIPAGAVVGGLAGALIGFPTFRLRGHYFALAMLAYPLATLYVFQWLGYQEIPLPMKREAPILYMQFVDPRGYVALALGLLVITLLISLRGREFTLWHVAVCDQTERAGGRGRRHRHLAMEDVGAYLERRAGGNGGRALCRGIAGGDARSRVRHAGLGASADPGAVRWRRQSMGPRDRRSRAGSAGRRVERGARRRIAGHPGRRLRHRDHRDHFARPRGRLLAHS